VGPQSARQPFVGNQAAWRGKSGLATAHTLPLSLRPKLRAVGAHMPPSGKQGIPPRRSKFSWQAAAPGPHFLPRKFYAVRQQHISDLQSQASQVPGSAAKFRASGD